MPHTLDVRRLVEVFDALRAGEDRLTAWERDEFLPNVYDLWTRGVSLTDRQLEILERIYLKV